MVALSHRSEFPSATRSRARAQDHSRTSAAGFCFKPKQTTTLGCVAYDEFFRSDACSKDPIGYEGSPWNLFEYVRSSPAVHVDPSGKSLGTGGGPTLPTPIEGTEPYLCFGTCGWGYLALGSCTCNGFGSGLLANLTFRLKLIGCMEANCPTSARGGRIGQPALLSRLVAACMGTGTTCTCT